MASRRMFSLRVINTARFLKMPTSTQCLYFHLGLHADDDGIVEAYPVLSSIGATEDDLKILVAKNFVNVLNEDLVTYITDWTENNKIRADRKIDSIYKDLLLQVLPEAELLEKKPRADRLPKSADVHGTSQGQPMDGIGQDRLGQDSTGQVRTTTGEENVVVDKREELKEVLKSFSSDEIKSLTEFCSNNKVSVDVVVEKLKIINQMKRINNRVGALISAIKEDWKPNKGQVNNNCNFSQRDYDYDSLEKQLLGWEE